MGIAQGYAAGVSGQVEKRRAKQQELNNYIKGFEVDPETGKYIPNNRGQIALDAQEAEMQSKLNMLTSRLEAQQAIMNENSMTKAVTTLMTGNANDAKNILSKNPILKQQLKDRMDVNDIANIDWNNDIGLIKNIKGFDDFNPDAFQNPEFLEAMNRAYFKVQGADGKWRITSTKQLFDTTNTGGYLNSKQYNSAINIFNKMNETLTRYIKTPEEDKLKTSKTELGQSTVDYANAVEDFKLEDFNNWRSNNKNGTLKQYLESITPTVGGKAMKPDDLTKWEDREYKKEELSFLNSLDPKKEYTQQDLRVATAIQGNNRMTGGIYKDITGKMSMVDTFLDINETLGKIKLDGQEKNAITILRDNIAKLAGEGITPGNRKEILTGIDLNTKVGAAIAKYVKFMSGAAVTNEEREMYAKLVQAGNWSNLEPMQVAMRSFTESLYNEAETNWDTYKLRYPKDYILNRTAMNKYSDRLSKIEDIKSSPVPKGKLTPDKSKELYMKYSKQGAMD